MFNRIIIQELKQWRAKKDRKPLIMLGARQVGKTSVLQKFGEEYFEHCAYFSLNEEEGVCDIFRKTKNPLQILEQLSYLTSEPILPQKTLLILDEIQFWSFCSEDILCIVSLYWGWLLGIKAFRFLWVRLTI